jgi:aspartate carbamoyltransferase catalytic subunit
MVSGFFSYRAITKGSAMSEVVDRLDAVHLMPGWETAEIDGARIDMPEVAQAIAGDPEGKNLLSILQLDDQDIHAYLDEARVAEIIVNSPEYRGISLLRFVNMDVVMRQASTRTAGSMGNAMVKLGGAAELFTGMASSSEAKGESRPDSELALATQSDILAMRTKEDFGPVFAAQAIARAKQAGKFFRTVPVLNLGDGRIEHPTQALGDLYIMRKYLGDLAGKTVAIVGDHERYRAHHSLLIGAVTLGMNVVTVESPVAPVPEGLVAFAGDRLYRTTDLDEAMREAHVLYMGRNPDEYDGDADAEKLRSDRLKEAYGEWVVDHKRLQQMSQDAILLHPRPRRNELHPSVDGDPRAKDVEQMDIMTPVRMAIIARHMGKSIMEASSEWIMDASKAWIAIGGGFPAIPTSTSRQ